MKFKDWMENKTFRRIFKVIIVLAILFILSFFLRLANVYPINQYQKQFERDSNGVINGTETIYLKGTNNKAIVMIHGLTDSPANLRNLAEFFNQRGYSVYVPLLPGHGTTVQDLNNKKYSDWYRAASNAYEDADEKEKYLFGYSLGGLLALDIASRNDVDKVITLNAPIELKSNYVPFIPFVKLFEDYQTKGEISINKLKELGFSVPYNAIPLNSVSELLKGISKLELGNVEEPILIIQGIDDDVVDRDSAIEIYDEVNSKEKKLLFLEDSSHQIISNEKDNYYSILNFITS